jgi:hypothetical protein
MPMELVIVPPADGAGDGDGTRGGWLGSIAALVRLAEQISNGPLISPFSAGVCDSLNHRAT